MDRPAQTALVVRLSEQQVVAQRLAEQARDLWRERATGGDEKRAGVQHALPVPADLTLTRRQEPEQHVQERRLAGPNPAGNNGARPTTKDERHVTDPACAIRIGVRETVDFEQLQ